jgi:hypothetical protein
MRRTAAAMLFAACAIAGSAGAALAGSDIAREQVLIEVAGTVEDACDEPILLTSGTVVETMQEFVDPNGRTHVLFRFHTFGLRGIGLDSGAEYRDSSHMTQTFVAEIAEGFSTGGFALHIRISSPRGDAATLVVTHRFHLVKRDGVNRLVIDDFELSCG